MKILYAEDEKSLSMAITEILKIEGFTVDPVYDGAEALKHLQSQEYDAAVLDIMMPKQDGVSVLQQIRDAGNFTPVMLLTAKTQVEDRINGLSCGADDYLGKPFAAAELVARLQAMIRRSTRYRVQTQSVGNITLDCDSLELKSDVGSLRLSSKECQLLSLFLKNRTAPLSTAQIQEKLWDDNKDNGVILLYISYLQNKLRQIRSSVNIEQNGDTYRVVSV